MADQSPPFNYLQYQDPEAAIKLAQIQARQGLAQALLQQGMQGSPGTSMAGNVAIRNSPLTGLANMLNTYSGGRALTNTLPREYAQTYTNMLNGAMNQPQPQSQMPSPASQAMATGASQMPNQGLAPGSPTPASNGSPVTPQAQSGPYGMGGTGPTPYNASLQNQIPPNEANPLAPNDQALAQFSGIPVQRLTYMRVTGDPKYQDLAVEYQKLVPANVRLAAMAGQSPSTAAAQTLLKANLIAPEAVRPGGTMFDPVTRKPIFSAPTGEGGQLQWGPNGPVMKQVPGALGVIQAAGEAEAAAKTPYTLTQRYNPQTQQMEMVPVSTFTGRGPGATAPGPAGPGPAAPRPMGGGNAAAPPLGTPEFASSTGTAAAKRSDDLRTMASESAMRVNVLDHIIDLSSAGVQTGPTAEFVNQMKGYVAGTPFLGGVAKGWQNDVAGFQELQKFTYQNALRNWQAAGGTGTDSQMEAAAHANPNDKLFPTAMQSIARWGKASEFALQGKAAAQDQWLAKNGETPQSQRQFEATWRANKDFPILYQLKTMPAEEATSYVANLKSKNPAQYQSLLQQKARLQSMGAL